MIEEIVMNYLNECMREPVYMEKPLDPPVRYVLVEKTGSSANDFIRTATLAIQSHAESLYEAAALNERVKEAMDNIIVIDDIFKSALNTDYNFTDTTKKKYRYQAVYDLFY